jgi:hypothetical protein
MKNKSTEVGSKDCRKKDAHCYSPLQVWLYTHVTLCVCVRACGLVCTALPGISEEESITYALQINSAFKHSFSRYNSDEKAPAEFVTAL